MIKRIILMGTFFLVLSLPAMAAQGLTKRDLSQLSSSYSLLKGVEERSMNQIIKELNSSGAPRANLQIFEAIAFTFRDISSDYMPKEEYAKVKLLSKIQMNMAYFQLGGQDVERAGENELNILIRRTLKKYLPKNIWKNQNLFHSLE